MTTEVKRYVVGFAFAVALTLLAYAVVVGEWLPGSVGLFAIMALAVVQLVVQLVYFLHLDRGGSRHDKAAFWMMLLVLLIIVIGSLWIMAHLDYNMMRSPDKMTEYMLEQSNKGF